MEKTINVNGKEYILKEDVEKYHKKKKSKKNKIYNINSMLVDEDKVMAVGTFKVNSSCVLTSISTRYLDRVIKCLKEIAGTRSKDPVLIDIAFGKDKPVMFGRYNMKTKEIGGFVIAPDVKYKNGK
jgi:hypothetical protein